MDNSHVLPGGMMAQRFESEKTLQALALLLELSGGRDNYMRLIKVLYMADRLSLSSRGVPITGDIYYALKLGPVLSETLDLIKSDKPPVLWATSIRREKYDIALIGNPGVDLLSSYEIDLLIQTWMKYKDCNEWAMSKATHRECLEYQANQPPQDGRKLISPSDILIASGWDAESVKRAIDDLEQSYRIKEILSVDGPE